MSWVDGENEVRSELLSLPLSWHRSDCSDNFPRLTVYQLDAALHAASGSPDQNCLPRNQLGTGYEHMPGCQEDKWTTAACSKPSLSGIERTFLQEQQHTRVAPWSCIRESCTTRISYPTITAVIADPTAYSGGDQDLLALACPLDMVAGSEIRNIRPDM